jgi:hypothetical protein
MIYVVQRCSYFCTTMIIIRSTRLPVSCNCKQSASFATSVLRGERDVRCVKYESVLSV